MRDPPVLTGVTQCERPSSSREARTDAAYSSASVALGFGGASSLLSTFGFGFFLYTDEATVVTEKRDVNGFDLTGWRGSGPLRGIPVVCEYID